MNRLQENQAARASHRWRVICAVLSALAFFAGIQTQTETVPKALVRAYHPIPFY